MKYDSADSGCNSEISNHKFEYHLYRDLVIVYCVCYNCKPRGRGGLIIFFTKILIRKKSEATLVLGDLNAKLDTIRLYWWIWTLGEERTHSIIIRKKTGLNILDSYGH